MPRPFYPAWLRFVPLTLAGCVCLLLLALAGPFRAQAAGPTIGMREYPYQFLPAEVTISAGDTVTWRNTGGSIHDVTEDSPNPSWTSGNLVPYKEDEPGTHPISVYSRTFTAAGSYPYVCTLHDGMRGVVYVTGATATPSATNTPSPTNTATATPTATNTPTPSATPKVSGTPTNTPIGTTQPTATSRPANKLVRAFLPYIWRGRAQVPPTATPTATATASPTASPTATPRVPTGSVWSDPASWGGRLPAAGEAVHIPAGRTIALDTSTPPLKSLTIDGIVNVPDTGSRAITAGWILVHGRLQVGSALYPFKNKFTVTLTGNNTSENINDMGTKFLAARDGGLLEIHGERRNATSWTRLNVTAQAGASQITVVDAGGWQVGDELVIAPTGFNPLEHERRTISAISGNTLTLNKPLLYRHYGALQTVDGRTLDERAEVGLLTRNIVIQGDSPGSQIDNHTYYYTRGFGGHVIVMYGGKARIEGVEFRRMGQTGRKGRYGGMHWHLVGEGADDYIKNSSIHDSFHRAVVTHGTDNVLVEKNVAYNVVSQAYMPAEDGLETGNAYICNLGVMIYQVAPQDYAFGPNGSGAVSQQEAHPGVFWTRNPNNPLRENAAAGALRGVGFYYDGGVAGDKFEFRDNSAHTISAAGSSNTDLQDVTKTRGIGLLVTSSASGSRNLPGGLQFSNFTAYKNSVAGVLLASDRYQLNGAMLADHATGALLGAAQVANSTLVGSSANSTAEQTQPVFGVGGVVYLSGSQHVALQASGFANYSAGRPALSVAPGSLSATSATSALRFSNTVQRIQFRSASTSGAITDQDGTLAGEGAARQVAAAPLPDATCINRPSLVGYVCN